MEVIYGRNPVYECLRAGNRKIFRLMVLEGAQIKGRLEEIIANCRAASIPVDFVPKVELDKLAYGHQGVALETGNYLYSHISEILARAEQRGEPAFCLMLDTLQDPQNLGTLLRTAEAVGIHGVFIPSRRSAAVTPAVVNSSSGACEHLLIARGNLAQTISRLKEEGLWVVGLERDKQSLLPREIRFDVPLALVVGGEASGMRPLVKKSCDQLVQLPMRGNIDSLNAAVAGSIALYLAFERRESLQ